MRNPTSPIRLVGALALLGVLSGAGSRGGHATVAQMSGPTSVSGAEDTDLDVRVDTEAGPGVSGFFGAPFSAADLASLLDADLLGASGGSSSALPPGPGPSGTDGLAPAWLSGTSPPVAFSGSPLPQQRSDRSREYHDFYFTRAVYGGGMGRRGFFGRGSWAVDYPKADRQFLVVLGETLDLLRVPSRENAVYLEDPGLRRFPFLYTLEVGGMYLNEAQVEGLRGYLLAGGFLVVDDFWGSYEWMNFEQQIRRVLPEYEIVDLPQDHEIFHVFYDIDEILQVPNIGNAQRGVTSECGPCRAQVRGIFDENGRLMVVINWNTDLGDAWEWSEQAAYPFRYSNFAYKMAVNFIVYAMTH